MIYSVTFETEELMALLLCIVSCLPNMPSEAVGAVQIISRETMSKLLLAKQLYHIAKVRPKLVLNSLQQILHDLNAVCSQQIHIVYLGQVR